MYQFGIPSSLFLTVFSSRETVRDESEVGFSAANLVKKPTERECLVTTTTERDIAGDVPQTPLQQRTGGSIPLSATLGQYQRREGECSRIGYVFLFMGKASAIYFKVIEVSRIYRALESHAFTAHGTCAKPGPCSVFSRYELLVHCGRFRKRRRPTEHRHGQSRTV